MAPAAAGEEAPPEWSMLAQTASVSSGPWDPGEDRTLNDCAQRQPSPHRLRSLGESGHVKLGAA
jgi:hypothetical protein